MAIDPGWDPDPGLSLPEEPPFVLPPDEELARWAAEDAARLAQAAYPWEAHELEDPLDGPAPDEPLPDDEPAWAVPGVPPVGEAPVEREVSAATQERLDDVDGRRIGVDPRVEARDSKPNRQASGLLDLISASHRAGLDHGDDEQHPGSPTASMPLPDLDDHDDTTAWPTEPAPRAPADHAADSGPADDPLDGIRTDTDHDIDDGDAGKPPLVSDDPPGPSADEPPPHRPWTPPDLDAMSLPGRERVTLTVTLDYETLRRQLTDTSRALALLGDSTWLRPDTARRLACDADIVPVVLGSKGEVLDVGRKTRAIPTATGRAVTLRDRHCAFPGCRRRARTTEIHHIVHWADHGGTGPDNLVCLCRYHHDLVHHAGWTVAMVDHLPWFTPPAWLDPTRTPRHNRPWTLVAG